MALACFPGLPGMGLFLPELGCTEAFGRPAAMVWDRNLAFSAGLGQLKETRSYCALFKGNCNNESSTLTQNHFRSQSQCTS